MLRAAMLSVVVVALATAVHAETPGTPAPAPTVAMISAVGEDGSVEIVFWRVRATLVEQIRLVEVDGMLEARAYQVPEVERISWKLTLPGDLIYVTTMDGSEVGAGDLEERIGDPAVMVDFDWPLDEFARKSFAPGTIQIRVDAPVAGGEPAANPDGTMCVLRPEEEEQLAHQILFGAYALPPYNHDAAVFSADEVAAAQRVIEPMLAERRLIGPQAPLMIPEIVAALPDLLIFPMPSNRNRPNLPATVLVAVRRGGDSAETLENEEHVGKLLADYPAVQSEADARRYVRTDLLLVQARFSQYQYGRIGKISVTETNNGGLTASAQVPITGGGDATTRPAAISLNVAWNKQGDRIARQRRMVDQ